MNRNINCSVNDCKHNAQSLCGLSSITVGRSVNVTKDCCDTECDSFECH